MLFTSCRQHKEVQKSLRSRSTSFLVEQVKENEFKSEWLSLKVSVAFKSDKLSDSFKMHIRMRADSVIWISATYYAVEVARLYITPDTVKFLDRKANQYFIGNFDYINNKFQTDLDFSTLQAVLLGNSVGLDDALKNKSYQNDGLYHISSIGKHQMKKVEKNIEEKINYDFALSTAIYPKTYKVARISIQDFKANKSLIADYKKFAKIEGQLIPEEYNIVIESDKVISAVVDYSKIQINKALNFSFNIPDKYEKIN